MFSDDFLQCIDISSSWKNEKIYKENESQCENIIFIDNDVQFPSKESLGTQTVEPNIIETESDETSYNCSSLMKFLVNASQITITEIEKSAKNRALNILLENECKGSSQVIQEFHSDHIYKLNNNNQYTISSLTWNCNASVLGVAYGIKDHSDWCTHDSYVFLWNVFKNYTSDSHPTTVFETDGCITIIEAHPLQPSIYAIGTINGKISLWNTRNENEMLTATTIAHSFAITGLHWIKSPKKNDLGLLISSSLDGKIFSWRIHEKTFMIQEAFIILAKDLPRTLGVKSTKTDAAAGIVVMSFNTEDPSIFIVGCHGGAIFQCSLIANALKSNNLDTSKDSNLKTPITLSFAPHRGHINVLQFSPFSRNIFFSCSVDCELRIYNLLHSKPIMVIHTETPLLSAQWSPSRPNIAAISDNGIVQIYSINDTKNIKAPVSFGIDENGDEKAILLSYNTIDCNEQIAMSTANGKTQIISVSLCTKMVTDKEMSDIIKNLLSEEEL